MNMQRVSLLTTCIIREHGLDAFMYIQGAYTHCLHVPRHCQLALRGRALLLSPLALALLSHGRPPVGGPSRATLTQVTVSQSLRDVTADTSFP